MLYQRIVEDIKITLTVKIKKGYIDALRHSEDFIIVIQLSRIVNSLRSNFRSYLNVSNNDKVIDTKDRIDLLLIHGSMLYEAIHEISKIGKQLTKMKLDKSDLENINIFKKEIGNKSSFTNTVLKRIRNKIFFHFDRDIIADGLKKFDFGESPTFALGISTKRKDVIYSFVDDLILSDLVNISTEKEAASVKYDKIENKIIDLSDRLCNVFDNIIKELMHGKLFGIRDQ